MAGSVQVRGLRELDRAFRRMAGQELTKDLRSSLKEAADIVAVVARGKFDRYYPPSAATMKAQSRSRGASVEQMRGKTTGQHAQFGSLQMQKALLPALQEKEPEVVKKVEDMLDRLGRENGF